MGKTHLQRSDTATRDMLIIFAISIVTIVALLQHQVPSTHSLGVLALIPVAILAGATALDLFTVGLRTLHVRIM